MDCYSFGVLVWEMYCGCRPFAGRGMVGCCPAWCGNMPSFAVLPCVLLKRRHPPPTRHVHTVVRPTRLTRVSSLLVLPGMSHSQVLHAIGMGRLLQLPADMPPLLRDLLAACMSKDPSERCGLTWRRGWLHTHTHTHTPCCNNSAWQCCACSHVMPVDRSDAACMWSGVA